MAKETARINLQCTGGQASAAPPVGPALGQHGVNIGQFIAQFNATTKEQSGIPIPVIIHVFDDRSFTIEYKKPPASFLIRQAAGLAKGAGTPGKEKVGTITTSQLEEIAKTKQADLNSASINAAMKVIAGTARSMGVSVSD
ncbi:MAG: 50S ribosomal protein L11 [Planctomycetes bacterium]|nr:50S ribosomal protein L11 [Planctomycetota bacterium]